MRHGMRRLGGAAGIALAATLAIAPAASATTDEGEDHKPAKPAGVVLAPHPLVGVRIAIDPGHSAAGNSRADAQSADAKVPDGRGGRTECTSTGSIGPEGYTEHEFSFEVSQRLAEQLRDRGAIVLLTRLHDDGAGPCVDDRGTFALDHDVDLMLSIHTDAQSGQDQDGFQVVLAAPPLSDSQREPSHDLAESMAQALQDAGYQPEVSQESEEGGAASGDSAGSTDRQVPSFGSTGDGSSEAEDSLAEGVVERSDVTTLNFARRPAVQLELGDLGDAEQAEKMSTADAQEQYAEAMTAGVLDWVDGHRGLRPRH